MEPSPIGNKNLAIPALVIGAYGLYNTSGEMKETIAELEAFSAVASHELQEPLRKIAAFGERLRLRLGAALDEESRLDLQRVQNNAARLSALIDRLRVLSRIGTLDLRFETMDLQLLLEDVVEAMETAGGAGAAVEIGPLPAVPGDRVLLRQLFENLISNALKFRRKDRPARVRVSAEDAAGAWHITVQDDGVGFDERYAARIFQPFQRLHPRSVYDGVGLGLAISQCIARRHGGAIVAESRAGAGARFTVVFPKGAGDAK